jgi:hypothetical protein
MVNWKQDGVFPATFTGIDHAITYTVRKNALLFKIECNKYNNYLPSNYFRFHLKMVRYIN